MPQPHRLIVAISGSTGPHYGVRLLEVLRAHTGIETHLILTAAARKTIEYEMGKDPEAVAALADEVHDERNIASAIASGTFVTDGMIVAPCSIKTLSAIANSFNDTLTMPAFYHLPKTVDDIIDHTVVKILDQFGIHADLIRRWTGLPTDRGS